MARGGRRVGAGRKAGLPSEVTELRHETFCQEYSVDLDAKRAAAVAGYKQPGALLRSPRVQARIASLKQEQFARTQIRADEVLARLACIMRFDFSKLFDKAGHLINPHEWEEESALAVRSISVLKRFEAKLADGEIGPYHDARSIVNIQASDRLEAIEMLMRHLGLFPAASGTRRAKIPVTCSILAAPNTQSAE